MDTVNVEKVVESQAVQTTRELVDAARMVMEPRGNSAEQIAAICKKVNDAIERYGGIPDGGVGSSYLFLMEWLASLPRSEGFEPHRPLPGTLSRMLNRSILILADDFGTTVGIDEDALLAIFQGR